MRIIFLILSCVFALFPQQNFAKQFNEIIAFGDSLTDVGNVAGLTRAGVSPVIDGYYLKTHFSDNLIWIEILANYWKLPVRTTGRGSTTTLSAQPKGNTWAWGGSEAAVDSVQPPGVSEPIPNLLTEVQEYLKTNTPNNNTLYSIWSGADNLLIGGKFDPKSAQKAAGIVISSIRLLADKGATNFLLFNMPNLGDTPYAQSSYETTLAANAYSHYFNKDLNEGIEELKKEFNTDRKIYFVDVFTEIENVVKIVKAGQTYQAPFFVPGSAVSISDASHEGIAYYKEKGQFPKHFLFWDDVHPTTQAHQIIAGLVIKSLKE